MAKSKELKQFGKDFLLTFTAELIRQHGGADFYRLKQILKEELTPKSKIEEHKKKKAKEEKEKKQKEEWEDYKKSIIPESSKERRQKDVKELIQKKKKETSPEAVKKRLSEPKKMRSFRGRRPVLTVPETRLPRQFKYLNPQPKERDIELGKLEDLVNDPNVKEVECRGPGQNIYVKGRMGYQPTQVTLSENEISELLNRFSGKAQIPIMVGEYHVAVGDLTLTANIDEDQGKSNFIIKKISGSQGPPQTPSIGPQAQMPGPSVPKPPEPQQPKEKEGETEESSQVKDQERSDYSGYKKSSMK